MKSSYEKVFGRAEEFSVCIDWDESGTSKPQYVRLSVSVGGVCVKADDWIDIRDLAQTMKLAAGYARSRECCELFSNDPASVVDLLDQAQLSSTPFAVNGIHIDDFARFNLWLHPALRGCSIWAVSCEGRTKAFLRHDGRQTACAKFRDENLEDALLQAYEWCDATAFD